MRPKLDRRRPFCLQLSLAILTICLSADIVRSQTPPSDILPPPRPETPPLPAPPIPLPPPEDLLPSPSPPAFKTPLGTVPGTITVKKFRFIGNTAFSSKTLAQALARFTNRPITFAELLTARTVVTEFYFNHGYITSGALIPANQAILGGIVTIQVVEGGLELLKVTGTRRLDPNYVLERLKLATSKPLNRNRLLEALQLLQLNPLIKNLSAELSAGSHLGTSVLEVQVTEAKTIIPQLTLDNDRPPSVGTFQRGLQLSDTNLLGLGDGLSAGYTNTDGSNNVNGSYTLPFNPGNGTLSLSYGTTVSHVVEPPFNKAHINANYRYYDVTLRQPLIQTPSLEFALGLTGSRRESDVTFLGSHFYGQLISPGADNRGRTRISALRFFQEWTSRSSREVIAARSQFNLGVNAINATIHRTAPDSRFFAWQGQGQWVRLLAPDTLLLIRGSIQLATTTLVPLEQFGLGGEETVRGYRQDFLLTDNAALASIEVRLPIYRAPKELAVLQLAPFVDVGTGWNNSANNQQNSNTPNTLASIGLGLRLQLGNNLTARFDYGVPLVDVSSRKRTWQEKGLHFSVQYNP